MKKFKEYIEKLRWAKNISEFPVKKDHDYTVSFIMPEVNTSEGIYRSLLPSMHLNNQTTIRALPVGLSEQKQSISINQKDYAIKKGLAEISDHIVFPFVSYPLEPILSELKSINKKLKFSYCIDYNFYFLPDSYPFMNEYSSADAIASIEKNITLVDQVIVTNRSLYKYLHVELSKKENIKGCNTNICYHPLFYDKELIDEVNFPEENPKKKGKKRFGLVMNQTHFPDLNFIKGILKEFLKTYSGQAEIVLLGWNGDYKNKNYLNNIEVEYHSFVPFFEYFQKLVDLNIDCFIIPAKPNKFNDTSKNIVKFMEFTRINKPVILPAIEPYKAIAINNDNAVLCDEKDTWKFAMEVFLKDPQKYDGLKDRAFVSIIENEISDPDNLKILMEIYEI
jgi:hypothetical protein